MMARLSQRRWRMGSIGKAFAWAVTTILITVAALAGWPAPAGAGNVTLPHCPPVYIGVPGSGQRGFSNDMNAIANELKTLSGGTAILEPALEYEAIPWYQFAVPWNNLNTSEDQGTSQLLHDIARYRANGCEQRTIMLAGYSQGAEVVIKAVGQLPADVRETLSIALLGNPTFTPNRAGDVNYNEAGQGIRPTFHQGRYLLPEDVLARTTDVCAKGDPICSFRPMVWVAQVIALGDGRSAHYNYLKLGYTSAAAEFLWNHRYRYPAPTIRTPSLTSGTVGQAYTEFLDTSDSRDGAWLLTGGTLPPGLSLEPVGEISGTPSTVGSYPFTVRFTDSYGQIVTGNFTIRVDPVPPPPPPPSGGAAYSFGVDTTGELGQGRAGYDRGVSPEPITVNGQQSGVASVAAAAAAGFAVNLDGTAEAWGYGGGGELAQGNTASSLIPVRLPLTGVLKIAGGGEGVLALLTDGTLRTWGQQPGAAPDLDASCGCYTTPHPIDLPRPAVDIAVGWYGFYALLDDGTVWSWGLNRGGELGTGAVDDGNTGVWTPAPVAGLNGVTALAAGYMTAYALTGTGQVWAWGNNSSKALGPNAASVQPSPVQVSGLPIITHITANASGAYALALDHTVWAWGDNTHGSLGAGTSGLSGGQSAVADPSKVNGLTDVRAIGAGGRPTYGTGFAVRGDGTLWSWGANPYGQLGYATGTYPSFADQLVPAQVSALTQVRAAVGGSDTTYAVADPPGTAP